MFEQNLVLASAQKWKKVCKDPIDEWAWKLCAIIKDVWNRVVLRCVWQGQKRGMVFFKEQLDIIPAVDFCCLSYRNGRDEVKR